jgi:hypothetical protein
MLTTKMKSPARVARFQIPSVGLFPQARCFAIAKPGSGTGPALMAMTALVISGVVVVEAHFVLPGEQVNVWT